MKKRKPSMHSKVWRLDGNESARYSRTAIWPKIAASDAFVIFINVIMAVGAAHEEIVVCDIKAIAEIIRAAPTIVFTGSRAAGFLPIPVRPAAYRFEFFKIELLGFVGAMSFYLLVDLLRVKISASFDEVFDLFKASGVS